eukprot:jgi/Mesvir1/20492/Mv12379-RA.1
MATFSKATLALHEASRQIEQLLAQAGANANNSPAINRTPAGPAPFLPGRCYAFPPALPAAQPNESLTAAANQLRESAGAGKAKGYKGGTAAAPAEASQVGPGTQPPPANGAAAAGPLEAAGVASLAPPGMAGKRARPRCLGRAVRNNKDKSNDNDYNHDDHVAPDKGTGSNGHHAVLDASMRGLATEADAPRTVPRKMPPATREALIERIKRANMALALANRGRVDPPAAKPGAEDTPTPAPRPRATTAPPRQRPSPVTPPRQRPPDVTPPRRPAASPERARRIQRPSGVTPERARRVPEDAGASVERARASPERTRRLGTGPLGGVKPGMSRSRSPLMRANQPTAGQHPSGGHPPSARVKELQRRIGQESAGRPAGTTLEGGEVAGIATADGGKLAGLAEGERTPGEGPSGGNPLRRRRSRGGTEGGDVSPIPASVADERAESRRVSAGARGSARRGAASVQHRDARDLSPSRQGAFGGVDAGAALTPEGELSPHRTPRMPVGAEETGTTVRVPHVKSVAKGAQGPPSTDDGLNDGLDDPGGADSDQHMHGTPGALPSEVAVASVRTPGVSSGAKRQPAVVSSGVGASLGVVSSAQKGRFGSPTDARGRSGGGSGGRTAAHVQEVISRIRHENAAKGLQHRGCESGRMG